MAAPASQLGIGKIQVESLFLTDEDNNPLLTEPCQHDREAILQVFNDTCSSSNSDEVFYLFAPEVLSRNSSLQTQLSWTLPPGLGLSVCPKAEICQGRVQGPASDLCGSCYCLDVDYKSVTASGSPSIRRIHSQCGITREDVSVVLPLQEDAFTCGYVEAAIFGATFNGNGTRTNLFFYLKNIVVNDVVAINQMQDEDSFLTFNLPVTATRTINPQMGLFDCQDGRVVFLPVSSTELSTNGTLKIENTMNLNSSSTYQFNVYAMESNHDIPSEDAINAYCSELPLFKQLIEDCARQTTDISTFPETTFPETTTAETTAAPLNIPVIASASVAAATVVVGGVIATLVTVLICVKKRPIETE